MAHCLGPPHREQVLDTSTKRPSMTALAGELPPLLVGGGGPGFYPNPLLAHPPEPAGSCLYLVTLGGFASSTGIWHLKWKISLVRSPWKQAEPLRRFTLNGAHPACIRCPVCLEFPSRLFKPLSRAGASLPRRLLGLALGCVHAALRWACLAPKAPDPSPCASVSTGLRLPPSLASPETGCEHLIACLSQASWRGLNPQHMWFAGQGPAPAHPDPFPEQQLFGVAVLGTVTAAHGVIPVIPRVAWSSQGVGFALGERGPEATPCFAGLASALSFALPAGC